MKELIVKSKRITTMEKRSFINITNLQDALNTTFLDAWKGYSASKSIAWGEAGNPIFEEIWLKGAKRLSLQISKAMYAIYENDEAALNAAMRKIGGCAFLFLEGSRRFCEYGELFLSGERALGATRLASSLSKKMSMAIKQAVANYRQIGKGESLKEKEKISL